MAKSSLFVLVCLFMAGGCTSSSTADLNKPKGEIRAISTDSPIRVTATVGMVADLVKNVGGARVSVTQICGSGVDPHLYKVTRDDVQSLRQADLVFYSGLMLEGKMADALTKEARARPVIAVTEALDKSILLEPEDFAGHFDPHVWMDISAWSKCVDVIADELAKFDPPGEPSYRVNAKKYRDKLAALHEYGQKAISSIPIDSRILVTSHDAFNYFGRAYGLDVLGVQGISTESEAGLLRINELVKLLVEKKVKSVFIESSVSSDNIEALIEGAKSKGHNIRIGEKELFSDAMGAEGSYEGTYMGMLDHNITTVVRGLGGEAPELGFSGKLKL
jgi:manganese/zinc/iron transport system substrate-binding protein